MVVAFGGDGTVNEAANGFMGSPHPPDLPARRLGQRVRQVARHPRRADRRHRAPPGHGRRLARAQRVDLGVVNGRCFTYACRTSASTPPVVPARGRQPAAQGPLGPLVLHAGRRRHVHPALPRAPPRASPPHIGQRGSTPASRRSCRTAPPSPTSTPAPSRSPTTRSSTRARFPACVLHRARPLDMPSIALRAFSKHARLSRHRQITALAPRHRADRQQRAAAGRYPCRSTATTLAMLPRRASTIVLGHSHVVA